MYKLFLSLGIICGILLVWNGREVHADTNLLNSVVISQLQTGGSSNGTAGQEFIELYNNASSVVDVTEWCVTYSSASDVSQSTVGCFVAPDAQTRLFLEPHAYALLASSDYIDASATQVDLPFAYKGGISGTAGHIRLLDSTKNEVDKLAWGMTVVHPETIPALSPDPGETLARRMAEDVAQDTDNNSNDFIVSSPVVVHKGGISEQLKLIDVCPNHEGAQAVIPSGEVIDELGNCTQPLPVDVCTNLEGLQLFIPDHYSLNPDGYCRPRESAQLLVSELLPNPSGLDKGHEFIEIYNPNDKSIDLTGYIISVGPNFERSFVLPAGRMIGAHEYILFSDLDLGFTLLNSSSRVQLTSPIGAMVSQTDAYHDPDSDIAWAYIDGTWQYTNQPTPQAANLTSYSDMQTEPAIFTTNECPAGKYRNPDTHRCRSFVLVDAPTTVCRTGYERNQETNRCRKVTGASAVVTSCDLGQERNLTTNRCRKIIETANPSGVVAKTGPPKAVQLGADIQWWALGAIGLLAAGFGIYEWHYEFSQASKKIMNLLRSRK